MQARDSHAIISIVTWNSERYISDLLKSLEEQAFQDFHIIFIDNASKDNTLKLIPQKPNITIIRNTSNVGFSRGHNKGIEMAMKFWKGLSLDDRYIFIVNPDIVMDTNCIRELLLEMSKKKEVAMSGPKLLRIFEEEVDNLPQKTKSKIVDSLGIDIYKSRKSTERFSGQEYDKKEAQEVFGVSGAFMCIRASALESIKMDNEYFDEDFFAYKEDVDLCWRMRNMGMSIITCPSAISYHYRRVKPPQKKNIFTILKNQKTKSSFVQFLSTRNHIWLLLKNDFTLNYLIDFPFIFCREVGKFFYTLFLTPKNIKAYFSALKGLPKMLRKRKYLKNAITREEVRIWIR